MPKTYYRVLIFVLIAWSYFARPVYDTAWIVFQRSRDKLAEHLAVPNVGISYDDVVALNTQSVVEIDDYIRQLRKSSEGAPEITVLSNQTPANYVAATKPLRDRLLASIQYPPPGLRTGNDFAGMQLKELGEDDLATYTLLTIPTLPNVQSIGVLILPKKRAAKVPLIVAAHGRGGLPDKPPSGKVSVMKHTNRDLARGAIEHGWAVYEPIFVFYGKDQPENIRELLTIRAQQAGTTLPAIEFAKTIRAIDYLVTRAEIDPTKVAMVGISYGGFNTLYTTAIDQRIKIAVVAAFYNDREKVLDGSEPNGFLDWRFSNSLGILRDPNIVALICPRPLQIQAGNQDQLFPIEGARLAAPLARAAYTRLNLEINFDFHEFIGRHDFDGNAAWNFINLHLKDTDR